MTDAEIEELAKALHDEAEAGSGVTWECSCAEVRIAMRDAAQAMGAWSAVGTAGYPLAMIGFCAFEQGLVRESFKRSADEWRDAFASQRVLWERLARFFRRRHAGPAQARLDEIRDELLAMPVLYDPDRLARTEVHGTAWNRGEQDDWRTGGWCEYRGGDLRRAMRITSRQEVFAEQKRHAEPAFAKQLHATLAAATLEYPNEGDIHAVMSIAAGVAFAEGKREEEAVALFAEAYRGVAALAAESVVCAIRATTITARVVESRLA